MINITSLSSDILSNKTKITAEIFEKKGSLDLLKYKIILTVEGIHESIGNDLLELIETELKTNGLER